MADINPVQPAKVDFTYAIQDLSEVSHIEVGNAIRKFTVQTGAYWAILTSLTDKCKTPEALQKAMAAKYKPHLNFYVMSPEFDYRQPAYLLSHPDRQKMRVHSMQIQDTIDNIVEEALRLQQHIIQNADLDVTADGESSFKGTVLAKTFGIGPKVEGDGGPSITLDTGRPQEFIKSLIKLFKLEKSTSVAAPGEGAALILKFLPQYMSTL